MGNAFAGAGLMYYLVGSTLNLFFEDEFKDFQPLHKNMICGSITGALYKSTLGFTPTMVGGVLGGSIIGG